MKGTKTKTTTAPSSKAPTKTPGAPATTTPSSSGQRNPGTASKTGFKLNMFSDKNSKDGFLKKLQMCMKTYDYKDETKDVRGKVS